MIAIVSGTRKQLRARRAARDRAAARAARLVETARIHAERAAAKAAAEVPAGALTGVIEKLEESVRFARVPALAGAPIPPPPRPARMAKGSVPHPIADDRPSGPHTAMHLAQSRIQPIPSKR